MPTCCVGGEDDGKSRLLRLKGESGRCIGASRSVRSIRDFRLRSVKHGRRRGSGRRRRSREQRLGEGDRGDQRSGDSVCRCLDVIHSRRICDSVTTVTEVDISMDASTFYFWKEKREKQQLTKFNEKRLHTKYFCLWVYLDENCS